jgi:hypothetical protein
MDAIKVHVRGASRPRFLDTSAAGDSYFFPTRIELQSVTGRAFLTVLLKGKRGS